MSRKLTAISLALSFSLFGLIGCNKANENTARQPDDTVPNTTIQASQTSQSEEGQSSNLSQSATLPADAPTYVVGTIASFPPFVLSDEYGNPTGFDVDIMRAIGEKEGFHVQFIISPWQGLLGMLDSNQRDIVATGVVITPERSQQYNFSDPYLETQWMGILKEHPSAGKPRYHNFADAVKNSQVFVTQAEAAGVPALKALLTGRSNTKIKEVESQFMELEAVVRNEADMAYDISRVLQYYNNQMGDHHLYGLINPNSEVEYFGYAIKKGRDDDLLQKINSGLKTIKEDGTYNAIYKKWFGEEPDNSGN